LIDFVKKNQFGDAIINLIGGIRINASMALKIGMQMVKDYSSK